MTMGASNGAELSSAPGPDTTIGIDDLNKFVRSAYQWHLADDPFKEFLPDWEVFAKEIEVSRPTVRIVGVIKPGLPNKIQAGVEKMNVLPAYFRRGDAVTSQGQVELLVQQGILMSKVLKSQLLQGGIDLTDFETGINITLDDVIPSRNLRRATDIDNVLYDCGESLSVGGWLICHPTAVAAALVAVRDRGLLAVNIVPIEGQYESVVAPQQGPEPPRSTSDQAIVQKYELVDLWPKNKVTIIKGANSRVGRNNLTTGESPKQVPGFWARCAPKGTVRQVMPWESPLQPKPEPYETDMVQVGCAALPTLDYPERLFVYTLTGQDDAGT